MIENYTRSTKIREKSSLGGCEYYVTFIDDHSMKTWIFFLKTKSEVFKRFQEFKALVEN
jgi:hypothetical protein